MRIDNENKFEKGHEQGIYQNDKESDMSGNAIVINGHCFFISTLSLSYHNQSE